MSLDNKTETINHLFNEKLQKYEDKLVEFILDIANIKKVNPKISTISAYLLIHKKLTQKELKKLTSFSIGSISTFLSVMIGTGVYTKERIKNTHTYTYSFLGKLEDLTTKGIEIALSSFDSLESYLKIKKNELRKLNGDSKAGAELVLNRINELLEVFEIYKVIFPIMAQDSIEGFDNDISLDNLILVKRDKNQILKIKFDPEVYHIEEDILNQLASSTMFSSRDPMFVRILGYFITRKYLTQSRLKKITGLSVGKISQEVNSLLENGLIQVGDVSENGKITYIAESAGILLLKFSRAIINRMTRWEEEIQKMREELEENKFNLEELDGFSQVYKMSNFLLDAISRYRRFINIVDKILKDWN
ncbi:MAG: hypothetical protein ACFE9Z_11955 [Promethearchaeota archaeon]